MVKKSKGGLRERLGSAISVSKGDASVLFGSIDEQSKEHFTLGQSDSHIDYLNLGIEDEKEKEELIILENKIKFHEKKTMDHILSYSEAIFQGNLIFSNNRNGSFGKWIEELGISRETANTAIRRYTLFKERDNKRILELPGRVVKELTGKNKKTYDDNEIVEIIESEKPMIVLNALRVKKLKEKLVIEEEMEEYLYKLIITKKASIKRIETEVLELEIKYKLLKEKK